ncbi:hypothetical protein, partial [Heyndrickxia coagulans]|uniref:hypothetical protein n=1 Tax=Heyndrickxia coagulans TaxID=1398 RepID=UPI000A58CE72
FNCLTAYSFRGYSILARALELKRFPVSDKEILSLKELEAILPSSKVNHKLKTDASIILNTELNRIYIEKWEYIDEISQKVNGRSYVDFYKEYFGEIMNFVYSKKKEILETLRRKLNEQSKNYLHPDLNLNSIIRDIEVTTKEMRLNCNFNQIQILYNSNRFSMYFNYKEQKLFILLKTPKDYIDVLKIWHEFGHAIHYQNMDNSLSFVFTKLHNLHNMEGIAILYQLLGNKYYNHPLDYKIYNMMWWAFVEFFSLFEWLNAIKQKNISDIFMRNLQFIFEKVPTYPCPIRYFNRGFKSFRYILGLFLALGISDYLHENPRISGEYIKEIMYSGGINKNNELIIKGYQNMVNS